MKLTTLVDAPTLFARLGDESLRIVDCQFRLNDPAWGENAHRASHIPGAVYAGLNRDLAGRPKP